jgi:transposase-like protein
LYFSGLPLRKTSEHLLLPFVKRNYVSIWNWIQHYKPTKKVWQKKRTEISQFIIIDETVIRVGREEEEVVVVVVWF